jgi:hypothetical protein
MTTCGPPVPCEGFISLMRKVSISKCFEKK